MVSTFTPNIQLEEPARGDDVGTWDTPVNSDFTIIDLTIGGINTISLNNSPVVLSAAQFRSKTITFNSTLTGSVAITFPTSFTKSYEIQNLCTGSSAFVITLQTTAAGGQVICAPPGQIVEVINDGTNIKFKNFGGPIGSYWDYAGSSVPAWNSGCTVPPYLNCDGSAIPAAYIALPIILGSSLLPDTRGRYRATANQGTTRLTSAGAGVNGDTVLGTGGINGITLSASQIPSGVASVNPSQAISVVSAANLIQNAVIISYTNSGGGGTFVLNSSPTNSPATSTGNNSITVTSSNANQAVTPNAPPTLIGGITMIRAG